MNFLKIVLQKLDDQSLGLLGAVLGENEGKVREGVKSAVPKVLDAMVAVSKVKEGRDMLWRELRDTDASVANNFSRQLYYKDSQSLVETGRDQLDCLMGVEASRLVRTVSREADLGGTTAKRLVGAVTPLVFASMADHQQSKKLSVQELADVIAAQASHLENWKHQDSGYFPAGSNSEEDNSPLFRSLPTDNTSQDFITPNDDSSSGSEQGDDSKTNRGGKSAASATASASAALGAHHFRNSEKDLDGNGVDESNKTFEQRSEERRQRESFAINPADASNSIVSTPSDSDLDNPSNTDAANSSKSGIAGAIAATGIGAAGVAAARSTLSKDTPANGTVYDTENKNDFSTNTSNTYASNSAVSGFSATTSTASKDGQNATTESENKRLWTPDSAQSVRDQDGTLRYDTDGTSKSAAGGKKSSGWFHWLWWPVLIFGSLLAAGIYFIDQDGLRTQITDPNGDPVVTAQSDGESDSEVPSENTPTAIDATSSDENVDEGDADQVGPDIKIEPSKTDASGDATDLKKSTGESTPDLAPADPNEDAASKSDSQTSDQLIAGDANQDGDTEAEMGSNTTESSQENSSLSSDYTNDPTTNESGKNAEANKSVSVDDEPELDADEQVEELLWVIETKIKGLDTKAEADAAKQILSQQVTGLEEVLSNREQWKDEIEILVDFQLEEGKKMLSKKKEKLFKSEAVKNTLGGLFQKLDKLMTPAVDRP